MLSDRAEMALESAAAESLNRIREDRRRVSHRVRPLLVHIEQHLFDPDLTVQRLQRECGVRSTSTLTRFHAEVGASPYAYVVERRLETAARMLARTGLQTWKIGLLVGYSSLPTFSNAFAKWANQRPTAYRRRFAQAPANANTASPTAAGEHKIVERLTRLASQLASGGTQQGEDSVLLVDGDALERRMAEAVWKEMATLPQEEQESLLRTRVRFASPVLFEFLLGKSREEGSSDRARALHLAQLALAALDGSAQCLPSDRLPGLRIRACAWLGNYYRLELDFAKAEQAFARAESEWQSAKGVVEASAGWEFLRQKAALRLFQRRYEEALDLANESLQVLGASGSEEAITQTRILRAMINTYSGSAAEAAQELQEVLSTLNLGRQEALYLATQVQFAGALTELEQFTDAEKALLEARSLESSRDPGVQPGLVWLEGRILHGQDQHTAAEDAFCQARHGFAEQDRAGYAAAVSLDLAILYLELGRQSEVVRLSAEIIRVFGAYRLDSEVAAALHLLTRAAASEQISVAALRSARNCLAAILPTLSA